MALAVEGGLNPGDRVWVGQLERQQQAGASTDAVGVKELVQDNWKCVMSGALGAVAGPVALWNCPGTAGVTQKYGATCAIGAATSALVAIETGPGAAAAAAGGCIISVNAQWAKAKGGKWRAAGYVVELTGGVGTIQKAAVKGLAEKFGQEVVGKPVSVGQGLWVVATKTGRVVVRVVKKVPH